MDRAAGRRSVRAQVEGLTPRLAAVAADRDRALSSAPRLRRNRWTAPKVVPADAGPSHTPGPSAAPRGLSSPGNGP